MHYLSFDFEVGGTDPNIHSLLTLYMVILDENFNRIDDLHLKLKPDNGEYILTEKAMKITGIKIESHDKEAIPYRQASDLIRSFLEKHKIKGKRKHFRPLGQNISFDIRCMNAQLIPEDEWEGPLGVHYTVLDTLQITTFLKDLDMIPDDLGNLTSLVKYFDIPQGDFHNEKEDVLMTIEVYKKFRGMFLSKKKDMLNSVDLSLFAIIEE